MNPAAPEPSTDLQVVAHDLLSLADLEVEVQHVVDAWHAAAVRDRVRDMVATGKRLGMPMGWVLDADTLMRRAERAVAAMIRKGQADGTVSSKEHPTRGASPSEFASESERRNSRGDYFDMFDGVDAARFEAALASARNDGNLSRANVVRHLRHGGGGFQTRNGRAQQVERYAQEGWSSRQIAAHLGIAAPGVRAIARDYGITIPADAMVGGTRLHDSNRIVSESVSTLDAIAMGLALVDPDALSADEVAGWVTSMRASIHEIERFSKALIRHHNHTEGTCEHDQ